MSKLIINADNNVPVIYYENEDMKVFEVYGKGILGTTARAFLYGFAVFLYVIVYSSQLAGLFYLIFMVYPPTEVSYWIFIVIVIPYPLTVKLPPRIHTFTEFQIYKLLYRIQKPYMIDIFLINERLHDPIVVGDHYRIHHLAEVNEFKAVYPKSSVKSRRFITFKSMEQEFVLGDIAFHRDDHKLPLIKSILNNKVTNKKPDHILYDDTSNLSLDAIIDQSNHTILDMRLFKPAFSRIEELSPITILFLSSVVLVMYVVTTIAIMRSLYDKYLTYSSPIQIILSPLVLLAGLIAIGHLIFYLRAGLYDKMDEYIDY